MRSWGRPITPTLSSYAIPTEVKRGVHIVTEVCRSGELFDQTIEKAYGSESIDEGASCFREKDATRIVHSLLSAVSHLHSKDIRDIKPE